MRYSLAIFFALASLLQAGEGGSRVRYAGGTVSGIPNKAEVRIDTIQEDTLTLTSGSRAISIPYDSVNTLEYGMRVNRRYIEAALISPVFLIGKRKTHYLTIGYSDAEGKQQAMVLEVGKSDIRPLLVSLEARTGRKVEYQDEEARKAGKG